MEFNDNINKVSVLRILQPRPLRHDGTNTKPNCFSEDWVVILSTTAAVLPMLLVLIYQRSAYCDQQSR
jgi:hypothetical protein